MDTDKTIADDICKEFDVEKKDVETRFDILNNGLSRPLPKGKNKKVIGVIKDKLNGKIMKRFSELIAKTLNYLMHSDSEDKKI